MTSSETYEVVALMAKADVALDGARIDSLVLTHRTGMHIAQADRCAVKYEEDTTARVSSGRRLQPCSRCDRENCWQMKPLSTVWPKKSLCSTLAQRGGPSSLLSRRTEKGHSRCEWLRVHDVADEADDDGPHCCSSHRDHCNWDSFDGGGANEQGGVPTSHFHLTISCGLAEASESPQGWPREPPSAWDIGYRRHAEVLCTPNCG